MVWWSSQFFGGDWREQKDISIFNEKPDFHRFPLKPIHWLSNLVIKSQWHTSKFPRVDGSILHIFIKPLVVPVLIDRLGLRPQHSSALVKAKISYPRCTLQQIFTQVCPKKGWIVMIIYRARWFRWLSEFGGAHRCPIFNPTHIGMEKTRNHMGYPGKWSTVMAELWGDLFWTSRWRYTKQSKTWNPWRAFFVGRCSKT